MPEYGPKKRYLSDEQCQTSAAQIAGEMEAHEAGASGSLDIWTPEAFEIKAGRLFHPGEVTAIRGALVKMGALSA